MFLKLTIISTYCSSCSGMKSGIVLFIAIPFASLKGTKWDEKPRCPRVFSKKFGFFQTYSFDNLFSFLYPFKLIRENSYVATATVSKVEIHRDFIYPYQYLYYNINK